MPLQIDEIGVHIAVGDASQEGSGGCGGATTTLTAEQIETLVRACVRDTLRTLRLREER